MSQSKIVYTLTDEAPALATYSFLPIVKAFTKQADISVETSDISLAARVLAAFPEKLTKEQQVADALSELSSLVKEPQANIIKLPNISASIPQLKGAILELQQKGYKIPDFPEDPQGGEEKEVKERYSKVLGSAVNPVLREGNSDRRAPEAVKKFAQKNPHKMGSWGPSSRAHVAHMQGGDFFAHEKSFIAGEDFMVSIVFEKKDGSKVVLKEGLSLLEGEVVDTSFMSKKALCRFFAKEMAEAAEEGLLLSLHVKATMMKVSDPIIFGHGVKVYFKELFDKHGELFDRLGVNPNNGFSHVLAKIALLSSDQKAEVERDIEQVYENAAKLAMVNSDKGITNLHVPSDVIVDASMPAMIRDGGKMWGPDGTLMETKALIPESTYATIYQRVVEFCKEHGAFDPATMGTSPNVGLMAKKAEEYGSHDKTFEMSEDGRVKVVREGSGEVLSEHVVEEGDIWRMCQAKDEPIRDWVALGVRRARASKTPAIFWLDEKRAHDVSMIKKVEKYLKEHDLEGLSIDIMSPDKAIMVTMQRMKEGLDTISVTGNVLRDYLTDLFPILELATSAKMLSIVPLMKGGAMFETGAGGSAPKHVEQFMEEGHLRWDSLGEFMALTVSLEDIFEKTGNKKAQILSKALSEATERLLDENKSPSRQAGQLDNRGSHFYLALFWAEGLSRQKEDLDLKEAFSRLATDLREAEGEITAQLLAGAGKKVDLSGYYFPDRPKVEAAMRPSEALKGILGRFVG